MSKDTHWKSALIFSVRHPIARGSIGVRCVALWAVLVFGNLPAIVFAQSSCPGIRVNIQDIRNSTGAIVCALFEGPEGFPRKFLQSATHIMLLTIKDTQARCDFLDIPPGEYALAVIHDEDRDGKLDANWLGAPTEGYGFSNDAQAVMSAPSFGDASFTHDGGSLELKVSLDY